MSMIIKSAKDYYGAIQEHFPDIDVKDIATIMTYILRLICSFIKQGCDVRLVGSKDTAIYTYFGDIKFNALKQFELYTRKMARKARILYKRSGRVWNGYYYFALTDKQYRNWLYQQTYKNKKTASNFDYPIILFKLFRECKLIDYKRRWFFRIRMGESMYYRYYKPNMRTNRAEFIAELPTGSYKNINR